MHAQPLIALVDCNNFYVSCERLFRPDLHRKPVAVLSNNDGCIVARSQEVKDLGIKMGVPIHQVQPLIDRHHIQLFSSNYALYADISQRVMHCLEDFTPRLEVYSIDESFLDLSGICPGNPSAYALTIKQTIQRNTGIPVCVGMGPTKTLAKLANYAAKKWPQTGGVLDLSDRWRRDKLMRLTPVDEVWGIGRKTRNRLQLMGIDTVHDLARQPVEFIRQQFNVVTARTVQELNGIPCQALDDIATDKQQIICSRSFKRRLTHQHELAEALAFFCCRAAEKLRQQNTVAGSVTIFIHTNPFNPNEPYYHRTAQTLLHQASADSRRLVCIAKRLLQEIYKSGYRYQKCGVQLGRIQPASVPGQTDLFTTMTEEQDSLMRTVDQINQRFPRSLCASAASLGKHWQTPVQRLSQRYTSDWQDLAIVKCH
jgi:DNA polymerase V